MREGLRTKIFAEGPDVLRHDLLRRGWAMRKKGGQIRMSHVIKGAYVSEELGEGGLRIKAWGEQQGTWPEVLVAQLVTVAQVEEDGYHLEGILRPWGRGAKGARRE